MMLDPDNREEPAAEIEEEKKETEPTLDLKEPGFSRELRYVAAIVLGLFTIFFLWAALVPIDSLSIAPGFITVASSNKMIQHPQGGRIKEIYVKENQHVEAQDPLLMIDDPQVGGRLEAALKSKYFYEIKRTRLRALLQNLERVTYSKDVEERAANDTEIAFLVATESSLFERGRQTHEAELNVLNQQLSQLDQQFSQIQHTYKVVTEQKKLLAEEMKAVVYLLEKQLARRPRLLALQRENVRLEGEMAKNLSELSRIQHQKEEVDAKIRATIEEWNRKNLTELEDAEQKLLEINPQLIAAQEQASHLIMKAPVSGILKGLRFKSKGEVIPANELIMEIVPQGEPLVIEAQLNPNDIREVHPGLKAKITIHSFSFRYAPNFFGKVQYVSPDAFVNQKDNSRYYIVRVSDFDEEWKKVEDQLTPGMPVEVMIINDQRTLLYYLFAPIYQSLDRAFREQ